MLRDRQHVAEEAFLRDVDAQQLRHLIEHDHEPDPRLETGQDRRGDEVRDEAQPQRGGEDQRGADQRAQCGDGDEQAARISIRHGQPELRAYQYRQRGGGADAEHARGAEQRIEDHRHEGGVEADGDRQPGHGRVGHRFGQHHCGGREASDEIESQRCGARLDGAGRQRVVAVRARRSHGCPRFAPTRWILLTIAKKNPVESPHIRIPVRPSIGPRRRDSTGSSKSP